MAPLIGTKGNDHIIGSLGEDVIFGDPPPDTRTTVWVDFTVVQLPAPRSSLRPPSLACGACGTGNIAAATRGSDRATRNCIMG